jgi:ATP-dependent DNA helicase RecG
VKTSREQFEKWLQADEGEHLEFKKAENRYDFEELTRYCVALANEQGGKFVLGVTDKRPRQALGTRAFQNLERTKAGLVERLHLRFEAEYFDYDGKRIVIFHVPSRPIGMPVHYKGTYWMRGGDALVPMSPDQLKRIFDEAIPDFSAELCPNATLDDLAPEAIETFRSRWMRKTGNSKLANVAVDQLLEDAELIAGGSVTYAALILLGTHKALGRHLAQAEVVFEYRASEAPGPAQQRLDLREGFFLFYDRIWETINLRNDAQHYQDGLFVWDVPTFSERAVREALLNAVSHREYRMPGSTFVRQYTQRIEIVNPGGFPDGVTAENILWVQAPRNRRIAEALARCGLVERAGQGADLMFEQAIRQSKALPDFSRSDTHHVFLTLDGVVRDPAFLRYLEKVGSETLQSFAVPHFLVLDYVHHERPLPETLKPFLRQLQDLGVVELIRRGRGTRYVLSRKFYELKGKRAVYTRRRGLDRDTKKALLLKHLRHSSGEGASLSELCEVLPAESRFAVQHLLRELKADGAIHTQGHARGARWFSKGEKGE